MEQCFGRFMVGVLYYALFRSQTIVQEKNGCCILIYILGILNLFVRRILPIGVQICQHKHEIRNMQTNTRSNTV